MAEQSHLVSEKGQALEDRSVASVMRGTPRQRDEERKLREAGHLEGSSRSSHEYDPFKATKQSKFKQMLGKDAGGSPPVLAREPAQEAAKTIKPRKSLLNIAAKAFGSGKKSDATASSSARLPKDKDKVSSKTKGKQKGGPSAG